MKSERDYIAFGIVALAFLVFISWRYRALNVTASQTAIAAVVALVLVFAAPVLSLVCIGLLALVILLQNSAQVSADIGAVTGGVGKEGN